ncbi:MAG: 50S ribosomal protein L31 [Coriobacteriia bacterium]|nr:50S ribosomal protein L31 [Coriobacteriia bacterium]
MKPEIHPAYAPTEYECSCGNKFDSQSTKGGTLHIELCDKCHPFFTGTQKLIDTGGRVQRFADKFGAAAAEALKKEEAKRDELRKKAEEIEAAKRAEREARAEEKERRAAEFAATAPAEEAPAEEPEPADDTPAE